VRGQEVGDMVKQHHRQHVAPNGRMLMVADVGKTLVYMSLFHLSTSGS
jgi:hypothetical protein